MNDVERFKKLLEYILCYVYYDRKRNKTRKKENFINIACCGIVPVYIYVCVCVLVLVNFNNNMACRANTKTSV